MQCTCLPSRGLVSKNLAYTPLIVLPIDEKGLHLLAIDDGSADLEQMKNTFKLLCKTRGDVSNFIDPDQEKKKRRNELTKYSEYVRPATYRSETGEEEEEEEEEKNDMYEEKNTEEKEQENPEDGEEEDLEKVNVDQNEKNKKETKESQENQENQDVKEQDNNKTASSTSSEPKENDATVSTLTKEEEQIRIEELAEEERLQKDATERAKFASKMTRQSSSSMFAVSNDMVDGEGGETSMQIKVVLRCRPLFEAERSSGSMDVVRCTMNDVTVLPPSTFNIEKCRSQCFDTTFTYNSCNYRCCDFFYLIFL